MSISRHIAALYREESRRVLATLIRLLGDFDLAEEALQDAFAAAVTQWPVDGLPDNPRAWLISAGRFKAIDRLRRRARFDASAVQGADFWDKSPEVSLMSSQQKHKRTIEHLGTFGSEINIMHLFRKCKFFRSRLRRSRVNL